MLIPPPRDEFIEAFAGNPSLRVLIYLIEDISNALNTVSGDTELALEEISGSRQTAAELAELIKKVASIETGSEYLQGKVLQIDALLNELKKKCDCFDDSDPYTPLIFKLIEDFKKLKQDFEAFEQDVTPLFSSGISLEQLQDDQQNIQNQLTSLLPSLDSLQTQIEFFSGNVRGIDQLLERQFSELSNLNSQIESRISTLESEFFELQKRLNLLPDRDFFSSSLQDFQSDLDSRFNKLDQNISLQENNLIFLSNRVDQNQGNITQLSSKLEQQETGLMFLDNLVGRIQDLENFMVI